ncbi:Bud22p PWA37_005109 [Arxiozyma heterogenica]|uniref:Bud22p n=1 Tax=Arxiozyma heterogenica TaxID=278026 RepID=UPI002F176369
MPKDNLLFKLDNLEYQYHYLNNTLDSFKPRLNQTRKLYSAKGKKTSQRVQKLLNSITLPDITEEFNKLRLIIFNGKIFTVEKNLKNSLLKKLNQLEIKDHVLVQCKSLEQFVNYIAVSKLIKVSISKIVGNKQTNDLENVPVWFQNHKYLTIYNNKNDDLNPSRIWNEIVLKIKDGAKIVGLLMNEKKSQSILKVFENGMDVFLNINKDKNIKSIKIEQQSKANLDSENTKKDEKQQLENEDEGGEGEELQNGEKEFIDIDEDEMLRQYEGLVADSDNENESEGILDPNVNYNEVTDEEPSQEENDYDIDEESEDEKEQPAKKKIKLPELMTGYYSGDDSESDFEEDKVAKEQASNKIKRKNRRGQRARRKIWEQKYGKRANHIQKELMKQKKAREQKQHEYEARVAKRAAKQAEYDKNNANFIKLGERGSRSNLDQSNKSKEEPEDKKNKKIEDHPSWVAKKLAEEKLKNTKFSGKKIKFD